MGYVVVGYGVTLAALALYASRVLARGRALTRSRAPGSPDG